MITVRNVVLSMLLTGMQLSAMPISLPAQSDTGINGPVLHVYGPGGPLPAMKEAAEAFQNTRHVRVIVTAGPTPKWLPDAKENGDIIYSGSEEMMSDLQVALAGVLDPATIVPLYLREAAILVRPGNPSRIKGIEDLLSSGHHILVVNGAGQKGLWEDIVGRDGRISSVARFRSNISMVASNSAEAKAAWQSNSTLDAWLIWTIWQASNPSLADEVPIDGTHQIYRDCAVGITVRGKQTPEASEFVRFLESAEGQKIFIKWGWNARK